MSFVCATKEEMDNYDLGFGKDDAEVEEEKQRMTSSDNEEMFPVRSWSDGDWIITPSESENQRFWPHSE
jgi:hypothetical protein